MRYVLFLTGLFLLSLSTFAQDTTFIQHEIKNPALTLKTDIFNLLLPFKQNASLGFDLRLLDRLSLDVMAGSYFASGFYADRKGELYIGPRLRLGLNYLIHKTAVDEFHVGIQSKTDYIFHHENVLVLRQGGQYSEMYMHERKVLTNGLGVIMTGRVSLTKNKKFFLNYIVGLGAQRLHISSNFPEDAEFVANLMFERRANGIYFNAYLIGGIHLGYILR